jgi:hypothetical protein
MGFLVSKGERIMSEVYYGSRGELWDMICYDYCKAVWYKEKLEKEHGTEFRILEHVIQNTTFYLVTAFKEKGERGE